MEERKLSAPPIRAQERDEVGSGGGQPLRTGPALDLTPSFRQRVGHLRRARGGARSAVELTHSRPPPSVWTRRCRGVVAALAHVQELLRRHAHSYVGARRYGPGVGGGGGGMSDAQREELDSHAYDAIKDCSARIQELQEELHRAGAGSAAGSADANRDDDGPQARKHREMIVAALFGRVQATAATLKTLQRLRLKQARAAVQRLSSGLQLRQAQAHGGIPPAAADGADAQAPSAGGPGAGMGWLSDALQDMATPDADEALMFEEENSALAEELSAHADAALQLEHKIEEISQMVSLFATKIYEQDKAIDVIHEGVQDAQDHVQSGNMQLTQASQQSFFGRFNVLLFMIIASAMLLFLDWYG